MKAKYLFISVGLHLALLLVLVLLSDSSTPDGGRRITHTPEGAIKYEGTCRWKPNRGLIISTARKLVDGEPIRLYLSKIPDDYTEIRFDVSPEGGVSERKIRKIHGCDISLYDDYAIRTIETWIYSFSKSDKDETLTVRIKWNEGTIGVRLPPGSDPARDIAKQVYATDYFGVVEM